MKRLIGLLLVLVMMASMLMACSPTALKPNGGSNVQEVTDKNAVPDLTGVTIRIMTNSSITSGVDYSTILPRWEQVAERTGCTIIWEVIDSDYYTVLNTRLVGDPSICPDIVMAGPVTSADSYIEDELFYNIKEAFPACPNIKSFYEETNPQMADLLTYTDGGIYQLAASTYLSYEDYLQTQNNNYTENHLWYRSDLAAKLGFTEPPETLDDWYNMLVAAKKAYPSMYIFDTKSVHSDWSSLSVFAGSFGLQMNHNNADNYFALKDGEVIFEPATDAAKAWMKEMNKWYKAGLLHDGSSTSQLYTNGAAGLTFSSFWRGMRNHVADLLASNPEVTYQAVAIPSVEGYERNFAARDPYGDTYAIVDNGDPEKCLKVAQFLDYAVYSIYGIACERLGPEGTAWEFNENGKVVLTENAKNYTSVELNSLGSYMWAKFPSVYSYEINSVYNTLYDTGATDANVDPRMLAYEQTAIEATKQNLSFSTEHFVAPYMSPEDQEEVRYILADLNTFTKEMITGYILGNKNIDKFQTEFVDVLYSTFRLQDLLDIYNKYV